MIATFKQVIDVYGQVMLAISVAVIPLCAALYVAHLFRQIRIRRAVRRAADAYHEARINRDEVTELDAVMARIFAPAFPREITCPHCRARTHVQTSAGVIDAVKLHDRYDCTRARQDAQ